MERNYKSKEPESRGVEEPPMGQYYRGKKISLPLIEEVQARIFMHIDRLFGE